MSPKPSKFVTFAAKINADIDGLTASGKHTVKDYVLDPGKFGRLASNAPLAAKYAACRSMNEYIQANGKLTARAVELAFAAAGLV